jgi:DNA-binding NarL/FixJ family response regulator
MKRILIASAQEKVRAELRVLLVERSCPWTVVAETGSGKDALCKAIELKPDIAIVDCDLPDLDGMEATREICARALNTQVLFMASCHCDAVARQAFASGARGYLLQQDAARKLIVAVRALERGCLFFSDSFSAAALQSILSMRQARIPANWA